MVPSLGAKQEYNDNVFFSPSGPKEDFITTLSPSLELINRTERLDTGLLARVNVLKYARNGGLDGIEQHYRGRLSYSLHPKLKLSAEAGYASDIRPDRDIEVSGLVMKAVRRNRQNYAGETEYVFSEKTRAKFSYSYDQSDFSDPEFLDVKAHEATLSLIHDLSQHLPATTGRMNLGYGRYRFRNTTVDYSYGTIGVNRALSETWNLLIDAGGSYARSEFEVERLEILPPLFFRTIREEKRERGWGWVAQASLSRIGEKTSGELTFNHRLMPATGTAGVSERTSLVVNGRHRFSYEFSGRLSAGCYINRAEAGKFSTAGIDEITFRANPAIRYEFTKDIALEASYSYAWVKDRQRDTESQRNLFMIQFIIQHPLFE